MTPQEFDNKYKTCLVCDAPLIRNDQHEARTPPGRWKALHYNKATIPANSSIFNCSKNGVHFSCSIANNEISTITIILNKANIFIQAKRVTIIMKLREIKNKRYEMACGPIERWLTDKDYLMGKIEKLSVLM